MKPPGQTGEIEEGSTQDVEIAEVADEVSASAAKLGNEQEAKETKDVEIAEVAAEVGKSAEHLAQQDERKEQDEMEGIGKGESKEVADTAAEVAESAANVQAKDERIADAASEVAESAKEVPEPTPAPTLKANTSGQAVSRFACLCARAADVIGFAVILELLLDRFPLRRIRLYIFSSRFRPGARKAIRRAAETEDEVDFLSRSFRRLFHSSSCSSRFHSRQARFD